MSEGEYRVSEVEAETRRNEAERDAIQRSISALQGALMLARGDSRTILETAMRNAQGRLGVVEKKIKGLTERRELEVKEAATKAMMLAQQETRLNADEKKQFAGFMKEDFFTKADFGKLEHFYANSWNRLSESGRNQLSQRVWEGVRRDEYTFTELPQMVREKETEQAYKRLKEAAIGSTDEAKIPEKDRKEFIDTYEAGRREEAGKILDRKPFKEQMFRGADSKAVRSLDVTVGQESAAEKAETRIAQNVSPEEKLEKISGSGVSLKGLKLVESSTSPSTSDIPNASGTGPARSI